MAKILVPFITSEGHTEKVAHYICRVLDDEGYTAEAVQIKKSSDSLSFEGIDGVILGASIHAGRYKNILLKCVKNNRDALLQVPLAFFVVCLSANDESDKGRKEVERYIAKFTATTGLEPQVTTGVAGALAYVKYNTITRMLMKKISKESGLPTDTSKNYEFTNWDDIRVFVKEFLLKVPSVKSGT